MQSGLISACGEATPGAGGSSGTIYVPDSSPLREHRDRNGAAEGGGGDDDDDGTGTTGPGTRGILLPKAQETCGCVSALPDLLPPRKQERRK